MFKRGKKMSLSRPIKDRKDLEAKNARVPKKTVSKKIVVTISLPKPDPIRALTAYTIYCPKYHADIERGARFLIDAINKGNENVIDLFFCNKDFPLFKYIPEADCGYIRKCILNFRYKDMTPLMYAANIKDIEKSNSILKQLLGYGATGKKADSDRKTILMYILERGVTLGRESHFWQDNIFNLLGDALKFTLNLATIKEQKTPLMYAQQNCDYYAIKALLNIGALVNVADINGKTPLMYALERGDEKIIQLLIRYKADLTAIDKKGNCVRDYIDKSKPNAPQLLKLIPLLGLSSVDFEKEEKKSDRYPDSKTRRMHSFYKELMPITEVSPSPDESTRLLPSRTSVSQTTR